MKEEYNSKKLEGHIGNLNLKAYDKDYKKGFILSSGIDEIAVYNEYGTGIVGADNPNPLAGETGYEYNVPSPYKGVIPEMARYGHTKEYLEANNTPNTWWYYKNGTWWHTEGMKGKNMYSSLVDELRGNITDEYMVAINKAIK